MRLGRRVLVALCVIAVSVGLFPLTACTSRSSGGSATVTSSGAVLEVGGVTVEVPAGGAPVGTKVTASAAGRGLADVDRTDLLRGLGGGLDIQLDGGRIQPSQPLRLSRAFPSSELIFSDVQMPDPLVLVLQSADGSLDAVAATWDPSTRTVSAQVPHLSTAFFGQVDLGNIVKPVKEWALQFFGIEYPRPGCAKDDVTVADSRYRVVQPPQSWVCVSDQDDDLRVEVQANSAIPFSVKTSPKATSTHQTAEVAAGSVLTAALLGVANVPTVTGGVGAVLDFDGTPHETITLRQSPETMLVQILVKVLEVVVGRERINAMETAGDLECMASVFDAGTTTLSVDRAAKVARAFFPCVGPLFVKDLPFPASIILTVVSAGPQFLVASALGIVNELTGYARADVDLDPIRPTPSQSTSPTSPNTYRNPAGWTITPTGVGPVTIGTAATDLVRLGLLEPAPTSQRICGELYTTASAYRMPNGSAGLAVQNMATRNEKAGYVLVGSSGFKTPEGAGVGSTVKQLRSIYGSRLSTETDQVAGGSLPVVRQGDHVIVFITYGQDSSTVQAVMVEQVAKGAIYSPDGC